MFFSEKKLRELANLNSQVKTEYILEAINSIGFEVESIQPLNKNENLKFGHVLNVSKNPNSEKLTVCEIEFNDTKRTIQTAATNVKKGDYIIAFIPGSKCNGIEIKEKQMANIVSQGMLASFGELGFSSSLLTKKMNEEILIVDKVDLSLNPIDFFSLNDNIIEVSILSNRSDAQSYEIFAKELAAYFHSKINYDANKNIKETFFSKIKIETSETNLLNGIEVKNNENFKLSINDLILLLKSNIKLEENDILNFANLTMIITGVSLRAFDGDKILENIRINEEKKITYLNDGKNNISLLGIDVFEEYQANINSRKIFFEFSQIDEKIVRNNSKISKKITYSSINNSRVISLGLINNARNFIAKYFKDFSQLINDIKTDNKKIKFDKEYLNNYAGFEIVKDVKYKNSIKSLEILGFKFNDYISFPNTRHNIKNMQNIVEEIFRFYGFNNFKPEQIELKTLIVDPIDQIEKKISALGYKQAWTYTLINKEKNTFNPFNFKENKNLKTFVSEEFNSIRNSIAFPLLNIFEYNFKRKIENISLFDIGMINDKKAIIIASNTKTYLEIKTDIEKITNQKFEIVELDNEYLHPNYNAGLFIGGVMVGWIGKFNPFKVNSDVIFAEIFEDCIYKQNNKFFEFNSNSLKERDITFEISKKYENAMYLNFLNSIKGIYSITLISTFKKDDIDRLTYKILMTDEALEKFDSIDWNDKDKLFKI